MKTHSIRKAAGLQINRVYDEAMELHGCDVTVPLKDSICTFDLEVGGQDFLVLDSYGDDLSDTIRKRIFGKSKTWTIAINQKTGSIFRVSLVFTGGHFAFVLQPWMPSEFVDGLQYSLPHDYLNRLDQLKNKKRPYSCYIDSDALQHFVEGEQGYDHLRSNVIFSFAFDQGDVEILGDQFRVVSRWESS